MSTTSRVRFRQKTNDNSGHHFPTLRFPAIQSPVGPPRRGAERNNVLQTNLTKLFYAIFIIILLSISRLSESEVGYVPLFLVSPHALLSWSCAYQVPIIGRCCHCSLLFSTRRLTVLSIENQKGGREEAVSRNGPARWSFVTILLVICKRFRFRSQKHFANGSGDSLCLARSTYLIFLSVWVRAFWI